MIDEIECITDYIKIKNHAKENLKRMRDIFYSDSIDKFKITKQQDGSYPAIITISGFLSEDKENHSAWKESILTLYPDREWFHVEWNAQKFPFGKISNKPVPIEKQESGLTKFRRTTLNLQFVFTGFVATAKVLLYNNFWHLSVRNSNHTGVCLAGVLNACKKKEFILVGHSLGARTIYNCLKFSSDNNLKINVQEVHLLGGAVGSKKENWSKASVSVKNHIYNYYSMNDMILRIGYRAPMLSAFPIGLSEIKNDKVINRNVSNKIWGHTFYIKNFHIIKHKN